MKKPFLFLILILLFGGFIFQPLSIKTAYADVTYLRVINQTTPFYSKPTDVEPLFFLPYTYYVKVIDFGEEYTHVECKKSGSAPAIDGYVPSSMLFDDGLSVIEPYVNLNVKTATTALLFEDCSLTTPLQYVFPDRELSYLGEYVNQAGFMVYYVSYNNRLGYVKEADVYPFSIPNHPNELTFIVEEPPVEEDEQPTLPTTDSDSLLSIKILIIASLLFAGIVALVFAIKRKPSNAQAVTFYDENDYE